MPILIRYGEIALKSPKTRITWEKLLINNIKNVLELNEIPYKKIDYLPTRGRIYLFAELTDKLDNILKKITGIKSFSKTIEGTDKIDSIAKITVNLAEKVIKENDSFALKVRRTGEHNYSSMDIAKEMGTRILKELEERHISVNLSNPDKIIYIEIRNNKSYIFSEIRQGLGGLPIGAQGKIISLFSGGIDSPVATWMIMRRGCIVIPIYFHNYPYVSEKTREKVYDLIKIIRQYDSRKNYYFYILPHGDTLKYFIEKVPSRYICILCKRMMYRIAAEIARSEKARALVTGENLGQVASQTLDNLNILDSTIQIPVFRPLIGYDKEETVELAKKIGTFSTTILTSDTCKAVPEHPIIKGSLNKILEIESKLDIDKLVHNAIKNSKKVKIQ
jgi:thiamine biosynthesis protein ThiI